MLTEGPARRAAFRALAFALALAVATVAIASLPAGQAEAASTTKTTVKVGAKSYTMKLSGNETAAAFRSYLSKARTLKMKELNGNEKYRYLQKALPASPKRYKKVRAGDVMLYGDDCLVVFYKTHKTSYSYTKIGRLTSTKGLAKAAGRKSVKVRFSKMKQVGKPAGNAAGAPGAKAPAPVEAAPTTPVAAPDAGGDAGSPADAAAPGASPEANDDADAAGLAMAVNGEAVDVEWEANDSVAALAQMAQSAPVQIQMSGYGGFEQVGPIGVSLPRDDVQMTTAPGDIVLYAGNQLVMFHGSNAWAYTRLGKIAGKTEAELKQLLGGEGAVVTISWRESVTALQAGGAAIR